MDETRLGPANVRWNDYIGTAAADDADVVRGQASLYEIAELDRDRWVILGVDLSLWQGEPRVVVYALDREAHGIETNNDIDVLADSLGEVPVTAVRLTRAQSSTFLGAAFKRISVRLLARGVREHDVRVVAKVAIADSFAS